MKRRYVKSVHSLKLSSTEFVAAKKSLIRKPQSIAHV
jgi:hypothetical protein